MNTRMTASELQDWCRKLKEHIGPHAAVSIYVGSGCEPYLFLMPDVNKKPKVTFYGNDWESLLSQAQTWHAAQPADAADAEFASWFAPAVRLAAE
jgi:hypothetical protein